MSHTVGMSCQVATGDHGNKLFWVISLHRQLEPKARSSNLGPELFSLELTKQCQLYIGILWEKHIGYESKMQTEFCF